MIKQTKSELKITENTISIQGSEIVDLRTIDSNFLIKQIEEKIQLREMQLDKKLMKTQERE